MGVQDLFAALSEKGIKISLDGGTIEVDAPRGAMTDDLRAAVRQHKAELVSLLQQGADPGDDAAPKGMKYEGIGQPDPHITPDTNVPDGVYAFENPRTGQRFYTTIYRCPVCQGTNWGPQIDDDKTWHCLTCAKQGDERSVSLQSAQAEGGKKRWAS
jgi:TubC N-terminal docking domain